MSRPLTSEGQTVVVALYSHKHGMDIRVFVNDAGATRWRNELARTYWQDAFRRDGDPEQPPADDDAAGVAYFDRSADLGDEFFETVAKEIEP